MRYEKLTDDAQLKLLDRWIAGREQQHFQSVTDLRNAQAAGITGEVVDALPTKIAQLEAMIERMRGEREMLAELVEREGQVERAAG